MYFAYEQFCMNKWKFIVLGDGHLKILLDTTRFLNLSTAPCSEQNGMSKYWTFHAQVKRPGSTLLTYIVQFFLTDTNKQVPPSSFT